MLEQSWQDVRCAWRGLRRARGFAPVAVLTLAVGIAGTTAMFAVVQGVLLRPLPVRDQDRLMVAWKEAPASAATKWPFRAPEIALLRESSHLLERVAGVGYQDPSRIVAIENGVAGYLQIARVTGDFFDVLGVQAMLGRGLRLPDDVAGAEHVTVITHGLWQRRYGGSRDAIGRRLIVNEQPFTIVGVMPPDVEYPRGVEAWVTVTGLASTIRNPTFRDAAASEVGVIARRRPGLTLEQTASELRALAPQLDAAAPPGAVRDLVPVAQSYEEALVGDVRGALLVLFAAVAIVLLIASANVANLLLMRGEGRRAELALRLALGATRARLVRQVGTESLLLALAAGAAALLATRLILPALVAMVPDGLPRVESMRIDATVVLFTMVLAFVTAALSGAAPALSSTQTTVASHLQSGARTHTGGTTRQGRRGLVVVQVALAVIVVAAAGLLTRSLLRLQAVGAESGADRLVLVPLALPQEAYANRERHLQFLNAAIERLESSPLVAAATPVNTVPFAGVSWGVPVFTAEGQSRERALTNPSLDLEAIHANYFEAFEVPIVRGRPFTAADSEGATPVAIVSQDVAARTWPGDDPIGKRLKMGTIDSDTAWMTVVGVAAMTRYRELGEPRATLYVPAEQLIVTANTFVLRTTAPLAAIASFVTEQVRAIDPDVAVVRVAPFRELLDRPLARPRFNAFLTAVFGVAAMFLAAVGLYALMAALVRLRQREIGIRMAIGASPSDVRGLVVGEGFRLAGVGAVIGLAIVVSGHHLLRDLLYEVTPLDPVAMILAPALLIVASALACYVPARRGARIDPAIMLRAE